MGHSEAERVCEESGCDVGIGAGWRVQPLQSVRQSQLNLGMEKGGVTHAWIATPPIFCSMASPG